jgi:hypothetical protein
VSDAAPERKSAATVLVEMAQLRYVFGISTDGEPCVVPLFGDPVARLGVQTEVGLEPLVDAAVGIGLSTAEALSTARFALRHSGGA